MEEKLIAVLFGVLLAFVGLNAAMTMVMSISYQKGIWKQLFYYWLSVLGFFFLQAIPQTELQIILFVTASYVPLTLLARIVFTQMKQEFPWKPCLLAYSVSIPAVLALYNANLGFTASALPAAVAASVPLLFAMNLLAKNWKEASIPQRFLLLPLLAFSVHNLNFAFFRMNPEAQLWGWVVSFGIYQTLGILLPGIVMEQAKRTENKRLFRVVEERTNALKTSAKELINEVDANKELIKVVLHDISNPLTSLLGRLYLIKSQNLVDSKGAGHLENALAAGDSLRSIIKDVRSRQAGKLKKHLTVQSSASLESGLLGLKKVYSPMLEEKGLNLNILNSLPSNFDFVAEEGDALINTVFSNLISNAIKFSYARNEINIHIYPSEACVVIDVQDYGTGIKQSALRKVEAGINPESSTGTNGEEGTGFGMLLAKNYIERNEGEFLINPENLMQGTLIRIKLKSVNCAQSSPVQIKNTKTQASKGLDPRETIH